MNSRQAQRKLRALFRQKPEINQPGRLVAHLLNELGVAGDHSSREREAINAALIRMEDLGEINLDRAGGILNGVKYVEPANRPTKTVGPGVSEPVRTAVGAALKASVSSAATEAQSAPPPSVTRDKPEAAQDAQKPERMTADGMPSILTKALHVLQEYARQFGDGNGEFAMPDGGTSGVIESALTDLTHSQVVRVRDYLNKLELVMHWLPQGAWGMKNRRVRVDMEVVTVTSEMFTKLKTSTSERPAPKKPRKGSPEAVEADLQEQLQQAVHIAEGLDLQNEELREENETLRRDNHELHVENEELKRANAQLEQQLKDKGPVAINPKLTKLMEKHGDMLAPS